MTKFTPPAIYNRLQGGIFIVIYVDVLFVINFFITFFLLEATAKITKKEAKTWRLIIASAIGGAYALVILLDLPAYVSVLSKIAVSALMMIVAFRFTRLLRFLRAYALFFVMNFVFLGLIYGIAILTKTPYIYISGSEVYLNIGARGLLVSAFIAYLVSCLVVRLYNRKLAAGEVLTLTVENAGKSVSVFALTDTGNKLREPFSGAPVIIADGDKLRPLFVPERARVIPAQTACSDGFMLSFKPERVTVRTKSGDEELENVYIALSDNMRDDSFSAVINPEILTV